MATAVKSNKVATTKVELSKAGVRALVLFKKAKAMEAKAKEAKAKAEEVLRAELGEALEATVEGITALKVQGGVTTFFDREIMKSAYKEAYDATIRETKYTFLKTL